MPECVRRPEDHEMLTAERATGPVIRLLIVDDHPVMRRGLSTLFAGASDIDVVGLASDAREAAALVDSTSPDIVLMDIAMPDVDGVEAIRSLLESHPEFAVLILTTFAELDRTLAGMKVGASTWRASAVASERCSSWCRPAWATVTSPTEIGRASCRERVSLVV